MHQTGCLSFLLRLRCCGCSVAAVGAMVRCASVFVVLAWSPAFSEERLDGPLSESAPQSSALRERFLNEYPSSFRRLQESLSNVQCDVRRIRDDYEADATFFLLDQKCQEILDFDSTKGRVAHPDIRVNTYAPDFDFQADRSASGPYVLSNVVTGTGDKIDHRRRVLRFKRVDSFIGAAFNVWNRTLLDLISDSTFEIVQIASTLVNGTETVSVRFVVSPWESGPEHRELIDSASVVLVPRLDWAVQQYDLHTRVLLNNGQLQHKQRYTAQVECERWGEDSRVLPKHVHQQIEYEGATGNASTMKDEVLFKSVIFGNVKESQFQLSNFELPDSQLLPLAPGARSRSLIYWILAANAVLCAVGWYLLRRRREHKST